MKRQRPQAASEPESNDGKILINLREFPPHGYLYREPSLNWSMPRETAMLGLPDAARALQMVRAQNPSSGLDPGYEACVDAIKAYTCIRLNFDSRWCGLPPAEEQRVQLVKAKKRRGCASCRR